MSVGMTRFGLADCEDEPQDVVLEGTGIDPEHCIAEHVVRMCISLSFSLCVVGVPVGAECVWPGVVLH